MTTVLRIGPADRGRLMTLEEFLASEYQEGYQYELIEGRLCVAPAPNQPENWVQEWLSFELKLFAREHPDLVNHVSTAARFFVPGQTEVTAPEPDVAAYRAFPLHLPIQDVRWQDVSPLLVVEILSAGDPAKDLVRNTRLYLQVPTIKEYWVVDTREDPEHPSLIAHRRHGKTWRTSEFGPNAIYETRLLPGFELVLDSRS